MLDRRKVLILLPAVVVVVALLTVAFLYAVKAPRPALSYPAGQSLVDVRGNCLTGGELLGCTASPGPRSFLTIRSSSDPRAAAEDLFAALEAEGWSKDDKGLTAVDHAGGGAGEDIQPVYCKGGCVGLFRFEPSGYVLAWWSQD